MKTVPKQKKSIFFVILVTFFFGCQSENNVQIKDKQLNILFIAVDDLRPEINCYGADYMVTPNLDRLAQKGMIFENAYCQQAVCAPSRNSIMTGMRPDALGIYDLYTFFRTKNAELTTLPQYFKKHGYVTETVGKIFHTGHGNQDDTLSWTTPKWQTGKVLSKFATLTRGDTTDLQSDFPKIDGKLLPYYCSMEPDGQMTDGVVANIAIDRLKVLKDTCFFFAVGFIKPHLPFVAPKKYWDLYNPADIKIPVRKSPDGMPDVALHSFGELRKYYGIPTVEEAKYLSDEKTINLIHGYRACVSMIDAQIGKLLDVLDELKLTDNTIIVLWGDHGWKVGEYGSWCKHTNFELDTRVPLFIAAPQYQKGLKTNSLAELVDICPTLYELAGLKIPENLEGMSLVPILKNPKTEVNKVAISQYPRGRELGYDRKNEIMGYSIFDGEYRFTRWQSYENPEVVYAIELYNHKNDRVAHVNLANNIEYVRELKYMEELMNTELKKYKLLKSHP